ncbi:MAG: energy transducer TonB [Chromatiales bacterium]|nr:MAG: energy transducer TonB [Chromatiales bacterium]
MRILIALGGGLIVALLLFWFDSFLISGRDTHKEDMEPVSVVNFIRVHEDEFTQFKKRQKPKEPEPPKKPPPPAQRISSDVPDNAPQLPVNIDIPNIDVGTAGGSGPYIGNWTGGNPKAEGEAIPIVRINPRYPRQALLNGIEGYVRLEFTILEDGSVKDVVVAESRPGQVFDRSAVLAVMKWKFKPRIIDGEAVPRRATSTVEFVIDADE